jgi:hypothetical protein
MYTIARTLEGLPVWPSYLAAKLGYMHGGKICINEPKVLTLEEAKAAIGYVGSTPLTALRVKPDPEVEQAIDDQLEREEERNGAAPLVADTDQ